MSMAKKNQLTKSDYLPMEDYKKLLYLLHKDRQYLYNPQIEMFAHFKTKSSFHKTKCIN